MHGWAERNGLAKDQIERKGMKSHAWHLLFSVSHWLCDSMHVLRSEHGAQHDGKAGQAVNVLRVGELRSSVRSRSFVRSAHGDAH